MRSATGPVLMLSLLSVLTAVCSACPNSDPFAIIDDLTTYAYCRDATISFDGSASYDPDDIPPGQNPYNYPGAGIVSYSWNFGGGQTGSGSSVSHTFTTAGYKIVTLTVTDNEGSTATITCSFWVL